jgi:hypothetical protein
MEIVDQMGKSLWYKLTKKVLSCPSCGQKLRVPIRPGKMLQVQCSRCPSAFILNYKIPLIEVFRWQSGKSLKQNLIDFHHRFWNLPLANRIQMILTIIVMAICLDLMLSYFYEISSAPALKTPTIEENKRDSYIRTI